MVQRDKPLACRKWIDVHPISFLTPVPVSGLTDSIGATQDGR